MKPMEDNNFCLPIDLNCLQDARLRLVPMNLVSDSDLQDFVVNNKELWKHLPSGPFPTVQAYRAWHEQKIQQQPDSILFGIYLKPGNISKRIPGTDDLENIEITNDTFAGTTGLTDAVPRNSIVEIGHVIILPRFHRTLVNTVSTSLLLRHLLDPVTGGGLQLRRVQWQANGSNKASIAAAQRLGFELEGIMRWARTIDDNKECVSAMPDERSEGLPVLDSAGRKICPGRHSAILALCWDDWLDGKRDHILRLLDRA